MCDLFSDQFAATVSSILTFHYRPPLSLYSDVVVLTFQFYYKQNKD